MCWNRTNLTQTDGNESSSSTEIITGPARDENGEPTSKRRKRAAKQSAASHPASITNLAISHDGVHAVITTGEDKSVHVLSIGVEGQLQHLSRRVMVKRPCAIAITTDDENILVGDKFGDVYALPMHFEEQDDTEKLAKVVESKPVPTPFKPSATDLTVHTARNLKTLEIQKRQAEKASLLPTKGKDSMNFEHELLLGHVSMLTDLVTASLKSSKTSREYIITADRDEHIRISRGQPQAHIIHNYCFGHTQFVHKLCLPRSDILVSGGGDDELFVWDWEAGNLLTKLDFAGRIKAHWNDSDVGGKLPETFAVSGVWGRAGLINKNDLTFWCACEGIAILCEFHVDLGTSPPKTTTKILTFPGNVLDVAILETGQSQAGLIVSVDSLHEANSRQAREESFSIVRLFHDTGEAMYDEDGRGPDVVPDRIQASIDLFYNAERLRKHGTEDESTL